MGFVAIHDSFFEGWVWKLPPTQRCVLLYCIRRCRWKKGAPDRWWNGERFIEVPRGSFLSSNRIIAQAVGVSRGVVERAIQVAAKDGMLTRQFAGQRLSLITLCNYARYQDPKDSTVTDSKTIAGQSRASRKAIEEPSNQDTKKKKMAPPAFPQILEATQKLPWAGNIPWFQTLFWFEQIKGWERAASNICEHCLGTLGMTWPILQEKLQASSEYLEANQAKYKPTGARQFYANQVAGWKNRVPLDRATKRRVDNGGSEPERLGDVLTGWSKQEITAAQKLKPA